MPREVKRLYTLREIQRITRIHWPTLVQYSRDPRVQKHKVLEPGHVRHKWKHRAIAWFMKFQERGKEWQKPGSRSENYEVTAEEQQARLEEVGSYEYDWQVDESEDGSSVEPLEEGAWAVLDGEGTG